MHCRFHTNIDCMKRFMNDISKYPIEPQVGDLVRVYTSNDLEVDLKVVGRSWTFPANEPGSVGCDPRLTCELHLPKHWESLEHFIKVMGQHGLR